MKHLIRKYILLLAFITQVTLVGGAQADTIALSFSGGSFWEWSGATIGWEFTVSAPINVTSLGVWDENGDGLLDAHQVGIWLSSGGAPLVSTTVTSANPLTNGFRYQSITPFTLQPGTYVIGSYMPVKPAWNIPIDRAASEGSYTTQSPITYIRNLFLYNSGFTIPTDVWENYDGGNFGPNFQFLLATPPDCECYEVTYTNANNPGDIKVELTNFCFNFEENTGKFGMWNLSLFFDSMNKQALAYGISAGVPVAYLKFHGDQLHVVTGIYNFYGNQWIIRGHKISSENCPGG